MIFKSKYKKLLKTIKTFFKYSKQFKTILKGFEYLLKYFIETFAKPFNNLSTAYLKHF